MCNQEIEQITPKVIFDHFAKRLQAKEEDLKYLTNTNRQFEKWLQCEFALSLANHVSPVAYDKKYNIIPQNDEDPDEKICDIAIEYSAEYIHKHQAYKVQPDMLISEKPFLYRYVDKVNFDLKPGHDEQASKKVLRNLQKKEIYNHYIELKHMNWIGINSEYQKVQIVDCIYEDLKKYSYFDLKEFKKDYMVKSVNSICCAALWDTDQPSREIKEDEIEEIFKTIKEKSKEKCDKLFPNCKDNFEKRIVNRDYSIILIMLSYDFGKIKL